ncbi:MAG: hypothetical protein Q4E59_06115, partial [Bacteroidales bacterium]|nr:hypothetical protein [Bacteroidales bacterium]
ISPELFQLSPELLEKYHRDIFQKLRTIFDSPIYNRNFAQRSFRNARRCSIIYGGGAASAGRRLMIMG